MNDSLVIKLIRVILNLYPIFSMGYAFYVYYYFLSKTGGYYPGKLPEAGEKLLRTYVDNPLMASMNIAIVTAMVIGVVIFSVLSLSNIMKSQTLLTQAMHMSLVLSGVYGFTTISDWSSES